MHSCDVSAAPPPAQGEALLLELGRLIVVGRGGQPFSHQYQQKLTSQKTPNIPEQTQQTPQPASSLLIQPQSILPQQPPIPGQQYHQLVLQNSSLSLNQTPPSQQQHHPSLLNQQSPNLLQQSSSGQQQQSLLQHQLQQDVENDVDGGAHRRILASKVLGSLAAAKSRVVEDHDTKMPSTSSSGQPTNTFVTGTSLYEGNARRALRGHAESLWKEHIPFCIEVLLAPECGICKTPLVLLERWTMSVYYKRAQDPSNHITSQWLLHAVRSQLHFSQISAWSAKLCPPKTVPVNTTKREPSPAERQRKLSRETCNIKKYEANVDDDEDGEVLNEGVGIGDTKPTGNGKLNVMYTLKIPGETYEIADFQCTPIKHTFPVTDIGSNVYLKVTFESLPRMEDAPLICCTCVMSSGSTAATLKRRRSKDLMAPGNAFSEDVLASTLAAACTVAEVQASCAKVFSNSYHNNSHLHRNSEVKDLMGRILMESRVKGATFSPDLGIINPDKGCASGISRKFYSPETSDQVSYHATPSSRGSTPDHTDFNDSGISCMNNTACAPECDKPPQQACKRKSKQVDSSYQFQVPSDSHIVNYVLLDDRMQILCRQKGKHRCNCDEESDQGGQGKDLDSELREEVKPKVVLDERRIKQIAKYMRRARKEEKMNQMRESGHSSQGNSECAADVNCSLPDSKSGRKTDLNIIINSKINSKSDCGTMSSSLSSEDDHTLRNSPELVHYYGHSHQNRSCVSCEQSPECPTMFKYKDPLLSKNSQKTVDSSTTTSIPILQASKFDHANRFNSFRSGVTRHGALSSRDVYAVRDANCVCSSAGCDQMASVKSFQDHHRESPTTVRSVQCQTVCCHAVDSSRFCNSDDSYRPSVKKLISSHTQTDNFVCDCGKPLEPKCFDCTKSDIHKNGDDENENDSEFKESKMKRSKASHNLAGVNKSDLLLEAMERTSRLSRSDSEANAMEEASSESNNCDNRNRMINKCECDKNIVYYNNFSADKDVSRGPLLLSDKFVKDYSLNNRNDKNNDDNVKDLRTDNTINLDESTAPKEQLNRETKSVYKCIAEGLDKTVDFIRKPRLRRLAPITDRLDKIVTERHEQKFKVVAQDKTGSYCLTDEFADEEEDILYKDEESGITYMKSPDKEQASNVWQQNFPMKKRGSEENCFEIYEKGLYGNFGSSNVNNKRNISDVDGSVMKNARDRSASCANSGVIDTNDLSKNGLSSNGLILPQRREFSASDAQMLCERVARSQSLGFEHSVVVPSVTEMDRFRCRLDSAASMVFHSRTGLPLTSSPAPLRRGKSCFDYDSSINSVSGIKSALYGLDPDSEGIESESGPSWSPGSSPGSPGRAPTEPPSFAFTSPVSRTVAAHASVHSGSNSRSKFRHGASSGLLGSFEESVLNGRLEPAATVAGFTAEIGASGAFCPPHLKLPVTVFFYSLGDNTTSAPYLGHINLGRRGYSVPRAGTVQVTLFNPHGTVVKMFVVMYDLAGMPPNSRTFLRQRTLCLPAGAEPDPRCLRYLIHLRFLTSKSGKVYLHTDIRIIVSRKADLDTAAAHSLNPALAISRQIQKEEEENIDPLAQSPALSNQMTTDGNKIYLSNGRCHNNIETGTFQRRTRKNSESPVRIFGGCGEIVLKRSIDICNNITITRNDSKASPPVPARGVVLNNNETCDDRKRCSSIGACNVVNKELSYELRSFTYGPENPKYSPR